MRTQELALAKKELITLQKNLGKEISRGKFRDEEKIKKLKIEIKNKKYLIGDISKELCGGPHVSNTSELGTFKIVKEEASSAGVRRIKAILE